MATPIGPWIDPTVALIALPLFRWISSEFQFTKTVSLVTTAGSVGGILATGMGFSLPTLYFLDQSMFNSWMASPLYFCSILAGLSLAAGGFGLWMANILEHKFVVQEKLAFPVGELVYKMVAVQNPRKTWELFCGFISTTLFCLFQDGLRFFKGFIPKAITLLPKLSWGKFIVPLISIDLLPMYYAIGFVTGHVIALPLLAGAISKICIMNPLNAYFFSSINSTEFSLAFGSGMVVSGTIMSFLGAPKMLYKAITKMWHGRQNLTLSQSGVSRLHLIELGALVVFNIAFLTYFKFSIITQIYLLLFTAMCTYEITMQAGKFGIARLGAFATFVMVPAIFLFKLSFVQIVLIATFVEICGGVACDILFGRKLAHSAQIPSNLVERYQWLGLLIASISVGIIFWLLITKFGLGSPELFALKAQNRQILIDAQSFNIIVLLIGFLFGFVLKWLKLNPSLVLGGILMPINISFALIAGGLMTLFTKSREEWYPFWSGVFAANSVYMLVRALI